MFKLARFKFRSVQMELQNSNWIRNLKNIENEEQLDEFVMMFMAISDDQKDQKNLKIDCEWKVFCCFNL
jgi:hypothetical protein